MTTRRNAASGAVPAAPSDDGTLRMRAGETPEQFEARFLRALTPYPTGTPEEYRDAARRYAIDFACWLELFLAGIPDDMAIPAFRATEEHIANVRGCFFPLLQAIKGMAVAENPRAFAAVAHEAATVIARMRPTRTTRRGRAAK